MGMRATRRVVYVTGSYALVPYTLSEPDKLVRVSRSVVFFKCQTCGAPAGQLCLSKNSGELMRDGHRRDGKRHKNIDVANACLELVRSKHFHEVHVLELGMVLKQQKRKERKV